VSKSFGAKKRSKFLFFVKSTIDVLSALTFSPISPHHFCTQFNALCIKSQMVLRNFPLMSIIGKALHKSVAIPQPILQTIGQHIPE
jgi:hypothetical protein